MTTIRVANAPCSWGLLEFDDLGARPIGAAQMLDELRDTGYSGTELGDWGFMPTAPAALRDELARRDLDLVGAFVPVAFRHAAQHAAGAEVALRTARLLAAATTGQATRPLLILADENGADSERTDSAGRIAADQALPTDDWITFAAGVNAVARAAAAETGLRVAFHPHCAGFVETPDEIARLLDLTDPATIGLVFDTGHYLYGTGASAVGAVREGLERFWPRIRHIHFKDCHPAIAAEARAGGWDYHTAVRNGLFCELGRGAVAFPDALDWLQRREYGGWIVVEQDVLPGLGTPRASAERNRHYLRTLGL
ncbi:MAG: Inosose dehydratase [uncultured Thermomicrobiales bacterium]|uniref:Inosose dehydratase n=1 Tax=uncultured Thermomicrobiales bacterium TaxID=1645740 RepID=A0A6J4VMM5_9BACT|nr:MAG: Inosose dehydratase [uncultured Thermomicrobiales bacterium]